MNQISIASFRDDGDRDFSSYEECDVEPFPDTEFPIVISKLDGNGHDAATGYSLVLHFSDKKRDTRHAVKWYNINYPNREDRNIHDQDRHQV